MRIVDLKIGPRRMALQSRPTGEEKRFGRLWRPVLPAKKIALDGSGEPSYREEKRLGRSGEPSYEGDASE